MLPSINNHTRQKGDRRLEIARRLAAEYLSGNKLSSTTSDFTSLSPSTQLSASLPSLDSRLVNSIGLSKEEDVGQREEPLTKKKSKLKQMKKNDLVYNMELEKKMISGYHFLGLENELEKLANKDYNKISIIVQIIARHLKAALFGCDIDIGICTDASLKTIEYFGDSNYIRKLQRRNGMTCFTCIDKKTVIYEAIGKSKVRSPLANGYSVEDSVTYVPLVGLGSVQGLIEIYGLQIAEVSATKSFQRSDKLLRAMINAKDYKFSSTVRLWKSPNSPPINPPPPDDGFTVQKDPKLYQVNGFLVAGYITEVCYTKRGVPYYGGPRYTIKWENGQVEEEISAKDLLAVYKQTPRSLGCCSILDDDLSSRLLSAGEAAGRIIENQKIKYFLRELRSNINRQHMSYHSLTEISLQAMTSMMPKIRDISLVGFSSSSNGFRSLVEYFPVKTAKANLIFDYSVFEIAERQLCEKETGKVKITPDKHRTDWLVVELQVNSNFYWISPGDFQRFFIIINRDKAAIGETSSLEISMVEKVSVEVSQAVELIWQNLQRRKSRQTLLRNIVQKLFDWNHLSINELCYNTIDYVKSELYGANSYIGLLQFGGNDITYVAASFRSKMEGKTLKRGEGVSFGVIDSLEPYILNPADVDKKKFLFEGSVVQVMYGRKRFKAKIVRDRGHEMYDIRYLDDRKTEAGVDLSRIIPIDAAFDVKVFEKSTFPFLCIPVKHKNKAIGVIGIDGIGKVPISPWVTQPDPEFVKFFENLGGILGSHIDNHRKKLSLRNLNAVAKSASSGVSEIMDSVFECLYSTLLFITGAELAQYIYDSAGSLVRRAKNVQSKGEISLELQSKIKHFNLEKASQKIVQKVGDKDVLLLFKLSPCGDEKDGKIYMLGISHEVPISEPDHSFLISLQKIIFAALQNTVAHKLGAELKIEALRSIRNLCSQWRENATLQPISVVSRDRFFSKFVECVHICFGSVNMYVGLLGMYGHVIQFFLASAQSEMNGKILKKPAKDNYISFEAAESMNTIAVVNKSDPRSANMFHFGPRQAFEFPFVVVPLVAHFDSVIGVMGVDACDDLSSESAANLDDLINFFGTVGLHLSNVVRTFKADDARNKLKRISSRASSYLEGFTEVKKLLLEYLPTAHRVVEVSFEPKEAPPSEGIIVEQTFIVIVHIQQFVSLSKSVKIASLECLYQDQVVFFSKLNVLSSQKPFRFSILDGDDREAEPLIIRCLDAAQKVVGRTIFDLSYFLNVPQVSVDVFVDSEGMREARVGQMKVISKVLQPEQLVGLGVESIRLDMYADNLSLVNNGKGINSATESVYLLLKWNGNEIYKSPPLPFNSPNFCWKQLNLYLKASKLIFEENDLEISMWSRGSNGKSEFVGATTIIAQYLLEHLEKRKEPPQIRYLVDKRSNTYTTLSAVTLEGMKVYANDLTDAQLMDEVSTGISTANEDKEEAAAVVAEKQYYLCELSILCARDLMRTDNKDTAGIINSYVCLFFNGVEIGKTSIVFDSANPIWSEESFSLNLPLDDEIQTSSLLLEVYHIVEETTEDGQAEGDLLLGKMELVGSSILNLLAGDQQKTRWYDLIESVDADNGVFKEGRGEIKVSGRPNKIRFSDSMAADNDDEVLFAIKAVSFSNMHKFDHFEDEIEPIFTFPVLRFNGRKVAQSNAVLPAHEGVWDGEGGVFRQPKNRSLKESVLSVEVWQSSVSWPHHVMIGKANITGLKLESLLGQGGTVTRILPIVVTRELGGSQKWLQGIDSPTVVVKGGPMNSKEIFEVDESTELWLDIFAAVNLPYTMRGDNIQRVYPNPYCSVSWNGRTVGRTVTLKSVRNPQWEKERFAIKRPLHYKRSEDALLLSTLRIDVYTSTKSATELLGSLTLSGNELTSLFEPQKANYKWVNLITTSGDNKDGDVKVKLRGSVGFVEEEKVDDDDSDLGSGESILEVISASGLKDVDAYGNTCPYVLIEWVGQIIGRTNTLVNSNTPVFAQERFHLSRASGREFFYTASLVLQMWSFRKSPQAHIFLGQITFDGGRLRSLLMGELNVGQQGQEYKLMPSGELTDEENRLVGGSLKITCDRAHLDSLPRIAYERVFMSVVNAQVDALAAAHTYARQLQVRVNMSLEEEWTGPGEAKEVHRTRWVKRKTKDGSLTEFNELFSIDGLRLSDGYLTAMTLRISLWDSVQDLLGTGTIAGDSLRPFLLPSEDSMIRQLEVSIFRIGDEKKCIGIVKFASSSKADAERPASQPIPSPGNNTSLLSRPQSPDTSTDIKATARSDLNITSDVSDVPSRPSSPDEQPEMKYSLQILSARGLAKLNTFGKGSDTYAEISFETSKNHPEKNITGKTRVIPNTVDPIFTTADAIELTKPAGVNIKSCTLRITMLAKSTFSADIFLGEWAITGDVLADWVNQVSPKEYPLKAGETRNSQYVQGYITLTCKKIVDLERSLLFNLGKPLPNFLRQYEVDVLNIKGFASRPNCSLQCVVQWGPVQIGQTGVIPFTSNSIFDEVHGFNFRVPYPFKVLSAGAARQEIDRLGIAFDDLYLLIEVYLLNDNSSSNSSSSGNVPKLQKSISGLGFGSAASTSIVTRTLLGRALLKEKEIIEFTPRLFHRQKYPLVLETGNERGAGESSIELLFCRRRATARPTSEKEVAPEPLQVFQVQVPRSVINYSDISELSEGIATNKVHFFIRLRFNGRFSGKTLLAKAKKVSEKIVLSWESEWFNIKAPPNVGWKESELQLELWKRSATAEDACLGVAIIGNNSLVTALPNDSDEANTSSIIKTTQLAIMQITTASIQTIGHMDIDLCFPLQESILGGLKLELTLLNVKDIKIAPEGSSTPSFGPLTLTRMTSSLVQSTPPLFAICKWNGREIGRTEIEVSRRGGTVSFGKKFLIASTEDEVETIDSAIIIDLWSQADINFKGDLICSVMIQSKDIKECGEGDKAKELSYDLSTVSSSVTGILSVSLRTIMEVAVSAHQLTKLSFDDCLKLREGKLPQPPLVEISVISVTGLPSLPSGTSGYTPVCKLNWCGEEIGSTQKTSFVCSPDSISGKWTDQSFYFRPPQQLTNEVLTITLWDKDVGSENFLGCVLLSFSSLLKLYSGEFSFHLEPNRTLSPSMFIMGVLTINIDFRFPYWDNKSFPYRKSSSRKLHVVSASNLPKVNGSLPCCKVAVLQDGGPLAKSNVVSGSASPHWSSGVVVNIVVDVTKPIEISLVVIHVNPIDRKEVIIGQATLPFEHFLRPPNGIIEVNLAPPPEGKRMKAFKFIVGGHLNVKIEGSNLPDPQFQPYSTRADFPSHALNVVDVRSVKSRQGTITSADYDFSGMELSEKERRWLGTAFNFRSPTSLTGKPEWLILPVNDISVMLVVEKKEQFALSAGSKTTLCIEREPHKCNASDPVLLNDVMLDVSRCLTALRRRDIYRSVRGKVLKAMLKYIEILSKQASSDGRPSTPDNGVLSLIEKKAYLMNIIKESVLLCFPGSAVTLVTLSADLQSMLCHTFSDSDKALEGKKDKETNMQYTLRAGQGSDWEMIGKGSAKSVTLKSVSNMKDIGNVVVIHPSLLHAHFPRFSVGVHADDVHLGLFHVNNFEVHKGGREPLSLLDEMEIRQWFEAIGGACGEFMYQQSEREVLTELAFFSKLWDSSFQGMAFRAIDLSMKVVQGRCRLAEVLAIDKDRRIKSLGQLKTIHDSEVTGSGHEMVLDSLHINFRKEQKIKGTSEWLKSVPITLGGSKNQNKIKAFDLETISRWKITYFNHIMISEVENTKALSNKPQSSEQELDKGDEGEEETQQKAQVNRSLVIGVASNGVEHCQPLHYDDEAKKFTFIPVKLFIRDDRDITVSIYEVDDALNILCVLYGSTNVVSFKENELSFPLHMHKSPLIGFDVTFSVSWPVSKGPLGEGSDSSELTKNLKGFNLKILQANELKGQSGFDTSCEVFLGDSFINRTTVKKNTLSPEWNETFFIPFAKKRLPVVVEVYEMKFLRKGAFLGRVEIPFEQLINPPSRPIERKLVQKANMNVKKQTRVGGTLTISYSVESFNKAGASSKTASSAVIREELWSMTNPTLQLTVQSAFNLAKAKMMGGSSDAFCVIYLGEDAEEPICKTKVVDNSLNPQWKETFNVKLNVVPQRGITEVNQFPSLRLEVYNYSRFTEMAFLGSCVIPPSQYLSLLTADYSLGESPNKKNNLVQGSLTVSFQLAEGEKEGLLSKPFLFSSKDGLPGSDGLPCIMILEVQIIKAVNLMIANRVGGKSDPFVVIKWNGKTYGETSYKKGNLNPQWTNEFFRINIGTKIPVNAGPLLLEVYDKDFFKEGDFLGQVIIPCQHFLHPSKGQQSSILLPRSEMSSSDSSKSQIQGSLFYSLTVHYKKQKPLSRLTPKALEVAAGSVHTSSSPMNVLLTADPSLERKRHQQEGLEYPQMQKKVGQQMERYLSNPFERTGLISELHYGQLMAAAWRGDHTVLKTDLADMLCIPCGRKGARMIENQNEEQKDATQSMYVSFRFNASMLAKRDLQFFLTLKSNLADATDIISERLRRKAALDSIQSSLQSIVAAGNPPSALLLQSLLELQVSFAGCAAHLYLLDASMDYLSSTARADTSSSPFNFSSVLVRDGISVDSPAARGSSGGASEVDLVAVTSSREMDLLDALPRICRHEVVVQLSKGQVSLMDLEWTNTAQHLLPGWDKEAEKLIAAVEGEQFADLCKEVLKASSSGMLAIPLIAFHEVFLGLIWIDGLDRSPQALYAREDEGNVSALQRDRRKGLQLFTAPEHASTVFAKSIGQDVAEALLLSRIRDVSRKIRSFPLQFSVHRPAEETGKKRAVPSHAIPQAVHQQQQQRSRRRTVLLLLTRFALRQIVLSIPAIRQLSVWAIDVTATVKQLKSDLEVSKEDTSRSGGSVPRQGLLSRLGVSLRSSSPSKATSVKIEQLRRRKDILNPNLDSEAESSPRQSSTNRPKIQVGYFVNEDMQNILQKCSDEKSAIRGQVGVVDDLSDSSTTQNQTPEEVLEEAPWTVGSPEGPSFALEKDCAFQNEESPKEPSAEEIADFLHAEAVRCTVELKEDAFAVSSGHTLFSFGLDARCAALLQDLFQNPQDLEASDDNSISAEGSIPAQPKVSPRLGRMKSTPIPTAPRSQSQFRFFIAAKTAGVGGSFGWGVIGENVKKQISKVVEAYEEVLAKLAESDKST